MWLEDGVAGAVNVAKSVQAGAGSCVTLQQGGDNVGRMDRSTNLHQGGTYNWRQLNSCCCGVRYQHPNPLNAFGGKGWPGWLRHMAEWISLHSNWSPKQINGHNTYGKPYSWPSLYKIPLLGMNGGISHFRERGVTQMQRGKVPHHPFWWGKETLSQTWTEMQGQGMFCHCWTGIQHNQSLLPKKQCQKQWFSAGWTTAGMGCTKFNRTSRQK